MDLVPAIEPSAFCDDGEMGCGELTRWPHPIAMLEIAEGKLGALARAAARL